VGVQVVALRDIGVGEELCHSYIQEHDALPERRQQLAQYAFVCACPKCAQEGGNHK
jgi:hypothetical protein